MAHLVAPNGHLIVSTLEIIYGTAGITNVHKFPDGSFDLDYDGETDVNWDAQETVVRDKQRVFVDEAGHEWLENELKFVEAPMP